MFKEMRENEMYKIELSKNRCLTGQSKDEEIEEEEEV
jgi:hypothetical protein